MALTAQDNAYSERISRTIKKEYLDYWRPGTFLQLKSMVKKNRQSIQQQKITSTFKEVKSDPL